MVPTSGLSDVPLAREQSERMIDWNRGYCKVLRTLHRQRSAMVNRHHRVALIFPGDKILRQFELTRERFSANVVR